MAHIAAFRQLLEERILKLPGVRITHSYVAMDEVKVVFITSSAGGIMPVGWVNGVAIGKGGAGPETARLRDAYWVLHSDPRYSFAVFKD